MRCWHDDPDPVFDGKPHGGFYSRREIREVIDYARRRWVTIVPEIEMPGHSTAVLAAYPHLSCTGRTMDVSTRWGIHEDIFCAGNEETFTFLEDVLWEVIDLFPSPYIHIGGDEAPKTRWKNCPRCQQRIRDMQLQNENELQSYFIKRMSRFVESCGRNIIGWDEITEGGLADQAAVMVWRDARAAVEITRAGNPVVLCPNEFYYLDFYQVDPQRHPEEPRAFKKLLPLEKVYSYKPLPEELSPCEQKNIRGVQGNVWTEYIPTTQQAEYMTYPRACAIAESGWTREEHKSYPDFLNRLRHHCRILQNMKINLCTKNLRP